MSLDVQLSITALGKNAYRALEDLRHSKRAGWQVQLAENDELVVVHILGRLPREISPYLSAIATAHTVILEVYWELLNPEAWEIRDGIDQPSFERFAPTQTILQNYDALLLAIMRMQDAVRQAKAMQWEETLGFLSDEQRKWLPQILTENNHE